MRYQAKSLKVRVSAAHEPVNKIRLLYRWVLSRDPTSKESSLALSFVSRRRQQLGSEPWIDYAQALLGTSELQYFH